MKIAVLSFAALAAIASLPASAQSRSPTVTDPYDAGDWWWLDTSGKGASVAIILVDGEGKKRGKRVELNSFMIYRDPDPGGATGGVFTFVIDCEAKTRRMILRGMFYADMRMTALPAIDMGKEPIPADAAIYRFACTGDRSFATHFGPGSRRAVAEAIFARYPE